MQNHAVTPFNLHDDKSVLIVESCSFVSVLISREAIEDVGYPIKEFFIWYDDIEYTSRITRKYQGLYTKDSIVLHKTKSNQGWLPVDMGRIKHYFYAFKNQTYVHRKRGFKELALLVMGNLLTVISECRNKHSHKSRLILLKTYNHHLFQRKVYNQTDLHYLKNL